MWSTHNAQHKVSNTFAQLIPNSAQHHTLHHRSHWGEMTDAKKAAALAAAKQAKQQQEQLQQVGRQS